MELGPHARKRALLAPQGTNGFLRFAGILFHLAPLCSISNRSDRPAHAGEGRRQLAVLHGRAHIAVGASRSSALALPRSIAGHLGTYQISRRVHT